jgi:transposase
VFASIDEKGDYGRTVRIGHEREVFRKYLRELPAGAQIALETSGCYYWIVDEIEQAGHRARLAHALRAKRRMEGRHKTNERDARGLALLLRNGTLPEVWIPPAALRDEREMLRWRMSLSRMRTRVKNRMHGLLQRYNVAIDFADLFGDGGRAELLARLGEIPPYSRESLVAQLQTVDERETASGECEQSLEVMLQPSVERDLLDSLPCVGKVLSAVMALEIGDVRRFGGPAHLASQLLLIRLFQQTTSGSVGGCPGRRFQRRCASFRRSLPVKKPAKSIWLPVVGRMASCVLDVRIGVPMNWWDEGAGNVSPVGTRFR